MTTSLAVLVLPDYAGDIEHTDIVDVATTRIVITLDADAETDAKLRDWCAAWGFDLAAGYGGADRDPAAFKFHLTLVASVNEIAASLADVTLALATPITVPEPRALAALGADGDTPVLTVVDADGLLLALRDMFIAELGIEPTFADFKPHVSLSYRWDGVSPSLDEPVPDMGPLTFDRLTLAPLD